jgi:tetratricopeptide (TPR) repeat protein
MASAPALRDPANARELAALERLLRRAGGFRLVFVVVNHPDLGARLAQAVREDLAGAEIAAVELSAARCDDVVELIERAASARPAAVFVTGLDRLDSDDAARRTYAALNVNRDYLWRAAPVPVVFWAPEHAVRAFARVAADLWSGRSGVFRFVGEAGDALGTAVGVRGELTWEMPPDQRRAQASLLDDVIEELDDGRDDRGARAHALSALGDAALMEYRYADAITHYEQALPIYQQIGDRLGEANTRKGLGDAARMQNRYADAITHYEQALPIYQQIGDRLGEANTRKGVGDAARMQNRYADAITHYEQALPIYQQIGDRLGEAGTLSGYGAALAGIGSPSAPLVYADAARLYDQLGMPDRAAAFRELAASAAQPAAGD